ncbi:MAG TPA: hypothetical protein VIK78_14675 [Ruminiclostridium sp.]
MNCKTCGNPLRVLSGGNKTTEGSTTITMVHIWGCLNEKCKDNMKEQQRTETNQESFEG